MYSLRHKGSYLPFTHSYNWCACAGLMEKRGPPNRYIFNILQSFHTCCMWIFCLYIRLFWPLEQIGPSNSCVPEYQWINALLVHQGLWQGCVPLHSILVIPRRVVAVPATFEILCIPMPYFRLCTSVKLNTRFVFESMYSRVWKQNVWVVLLSHIRFVCVWRATSSMFLHSEICLPRLWCAEWVHINVFSQEEIKEANFVGKLHGQVLWSYL